ncbi:MULTISPECIES: DUF4352 domain-containing protein [unclassified Streptomyces]|uniref:DUF4352 domain-containing protein n=1 Tax=unclassified Streptomyces TaxID=2593676 RepID=UPI00055D2D1A|nr:DUF4352 domain-containing protein [Streptomyces sp. NRRL S-241]
MSQQFPPGQPQPGYGYPPQPQPKKTSPGKIIGFGCLGIVGLFLLIGIVGAALGGGKDDKAKEPAAPPAAASSAPAKAPESKPAEPEKKAAVVVVAKAAEFKKTVLAQGDGYTSVSVTVTNNGSKPINVNPLYFAITDTNGTKHNAELGVDKDQIGTVELAPGENVTGAVTGKGAWTAKTVTYTDGLIGDSVRANVS